MPQQLYRINERTSWRRSIGTSHQTVLWPHSLPSAPKPLSHSAAAASLLSSASAAAFPTKRHRASASLTPAPASSTPSVPPSSTSASGASAAGSLPHSHPNPQPPRRRDGAVSATPPTPSAASFAAVTDAGVPFAPPPSRSRPLDRQLDMPGLNPSTTQHCTARRTVSSGAGAAAAAAASTGAHCPGCTRRTAGLALVAATAAVATAGGGALAAAPAAAAAAIAGGDGGGAGGRFSAQVTSPAGQERREDGGGDDAAAAAGRPPRRRNWPPVPSVPLARGLRVSKVMRGCWQLSGRHKGDELTDRTSGGAAVSDLAAFHAAGVTSLDLADNYGPAELLVGQYLRMYPDFNTPATTIATKLSYLNEEDMSTASRSMVEYAVRRSLVRLGRQRLDLVQLQWAEPVRHRRWLDVLKWLADLREEGLIGQLGVCNFAVPQLAMAVDSGVNVVSNQVQLSLVDRRPQLFMQQAAASYGIKLLAYGTVAGGLLADKFYGVPASKVRLDTASKQKYGLMVRQAGGGGSGGWEWLQEVLEAARTVAQRHGVSASAVATAWVLHQPQVAAVIVGARNARHIRDMQAACALQLDEVDMLDLDAVWEGVPQPPTSDVYVWERGGDW